MKFCLNSASVISGVGAWTALNNDNCCMAFTAEKAQSAAEAALCAIPISFV